MFDTAIPEEPVFLHADHVQFDTAIVSTAANARDAMNGEARVERTSLWPLE